MHKTKFALKELEILLFNKTKIILWFDGNGKITAGNGTFEKPTANSFSLVQQTDCPFATEICKSVCYVNGLKESAPDVYDKYKHNSRAMREILNNTDLTDLTVKAFAEYIGNNCSKGFRWHVSGDIFSMKYAQFIASVCRKVPSIRFWIYTRSFNYLLPLFKIQNLVINLSADKDNAKEAVLARNRFGFRICYLTASGEVPEGLPIGSVIFPSYNLRGRDLPDPTTSVWWQSLSYTQKKMVCPADFFGQSEERRCGPCRKCLASMQYPLL